MIDLIHFCYRFSFLYYNRARLDVPFYHTACRNEAIVSNSRATQYNSIGSYPAVLSNNDRSGNIFISADSMFRVKHMIMVINIHPRSHYRVTSYGDAIVAHKHAITVYTHHLTDSQPASI